MSAPEAGQREARLVRAVVLRLQREGGACALQDVVPFCPGLRAQLGDRKLLAFLQDHPEVFRLSGGELNARLVGEDRVCSSSGNALKVRLLDDIDETAYMEPRLQASNSLQALPTPPGVSQLVCSQCGEHSFSSRNALFKHIRLEHPAAGSEGGETCHAPPPSKALQRARDDVLHKLELYFKEKYPSAAAPFTHVLTDRKIKSSIRSYLLILPMSILAADKRHEYESPLWWERAAAQLLLLMRQCNSFSIQNYDFPDLTTDLEAEKQLKDVLVQFHFPCDTSAIPEQTCQNALQKLNICSDDEQDEDTNACSHPPIDFTWKDVDILHLAPRMIFVNKRAGIRMESLVSCCNQHFRPINRDAIFTMQQSKISEPDTYVINSVSRLDQPTSGVVVLPLSLPCEQVLTKKFKARKVDKYYLCIVRGDLREHCLANNDSESDIRDIQSFYCGDIDHKLRHVKGQMKTFVHPSGKKSITKFCCVATFGSTQSEGSEGVTCCHSLVICKPLTGRTHQIRSHMAYIGYPLLGDMKYDKQQSLQKTDSITRRANDMFSRLMLHSHQIKLNFTTDEQIACDQPSTHITVTSPIPSSILQCCRYLSNPNEAIAGGESFDGSGNNYDTIISRGIYCLENYSEVKENTI